MEDFIEGFAKGVEYMFSSLRVAEGGVAISVYQPLLGLDCFANSGNDVDVYI